MKVISAPEHEAMIRWIRVTRNDAVINARLCLSNSGRTRRLSSRRVLKGRMQVEWFSEPKRQVSIVDPWKGGRHGVGARGLWLDPPKPRTTCTNSDRVYTVRKLASVIGRSMWEACCPHRSLDSSLLDHFSLVTNFSTLKILSFAARTLDVKHGGHCHLQ